MNEGICLVDENTQNGNKIDIYETQNIDQGDVHLNQGLTMQMNN